MSIIAQYATVQFITIDAIKQNSVINGNVDDELLKSTIKYAQDIEITKLLGTQLLVDLQQKVYNTNSNMVSGTTYSPVLNQDEINLLDVYVAPLMIWLVMTDAPIFTTFKYTNKGIQVQNSDNSNAASDNELQLLVNKARNIADSYKQRAMNYLWANTSLYPKYNTTKTLDDIQAAHNAYKASYVSSADTDRYFPFGYDRCCGWRYR